MSRQTRRGSASPPTCVLPTRARSHPLFLRAMCSNDCGVELLLSLGLRQHGSSGSADASAAAAAAAASHGGAGGSDFHAVCVRAILAHLEKARPWLPPPASTASGAADGDAAATSAPPAAAEADDAVAAAIRAAAAFARPHYESTVRVGPGRRPLDSAAE